MTKSPALWRIGAATMTAILLSACGSSAAPTSAPTNTPAATATQPPTATPAPTATPIPTVVPAPTEAKAGSSDGGNKAGGNSDSLSFRMARISEAKSYSVKMKMIVAGDLMDLPTASSAELPLFDMEGVYNSGNSRTLLKGLFAGLLGNENGFETITVDGVSYIKGPIPLLGAKEEKWYVLPEDRKGDAQTPFDPKSMINDLAKDEDTDKAMQKSGTEEIDGETCDVYVATKENLLAMKSNGSLTRDFERVDTAEAKALICPDGFLHLMRMAFSGASKKSPDKVSSALLEIRLFDFGKAANIEAPADAAKLEAPDFLAMADGAATPEATAASTETEAAADDGAAADTVVPADSNDGSFETDYPLVGKVTEFIKLPGGGDAINYQTNSGLKDVYDFYVGELTKDGLKERKITTVVNETVINLVMDGADGGKSVIVQAFQLSPGVVNVNVRKEKV
jgi:hypothetical protein